MQTFSNSDAALSLARGVTLDLEYAGQMPFKTLKVNDRDRAAGIYSASQGPAAVKSVLVGDGALQILEGQEAGTLISIR
jgi:hypothetical protein